MSALDLELVLVMGLTSISCALLGAFLVVRRLAMVSDAIGHVLLFGIVVAFFIFRDLQSPGLILGAAIAGLLLVGLVEALVRSQRVKEDAAIGLVFPALFAGGILLASMYFKNTHLDVDQVFLGMPEYAVWRRVIVGDYDIGSVSRYIMAGVFLINLAFLLLFWKELKIATFDATLAAAFGFLPGALHYCLMGLVSLTAVTAFENVGPVLVVAFMIVPAAAGYLLVDRMSSLVLVSVVIALVGTLAGLMVARQFDTSIAGTIATLLGVESALIILVAPRRGIVSLMVHRYRQRRQLIRTLLREQQRGGMSWPLARDQGGESATSH